MSQRREIIRKEPPGELLRNLSPKSGTNSRRSCTPPAGQSVAGQQEKCATPCDVRGHNCYSPYSVRTNGCFKGRVNQIDAKVEQERQEDRYTEEGSRVGEGGEEEQVSPVQPRAQHAERPINDGTVEGFFLKLKLPVFTGEKLKENPQHFINEMEKRFTLVECGPLRAMEFTGFRLEDVAATWYATHITDPITRRPRVQWPEFRRLLLDKFLFETVIKKRGYEFETIKQGAMTVGEYERKFIDLS